MTLRNLIGVVALLSGSALAAAASPEAPDVLVTRVSSDVLATVKADSSIQAGDVDRIVALVNEKILPFFDFERMTASAVGPRWNEATIAQKQALQQQFEVLLVRVYSGALAKARDRTVVLKPMRDDVSAPQVVVRAEVRGNGDPVELDFRLEKAEPSWRIYDMNVGGVWLVDNYRGSFAQEIGAVGIDGLIARLTEKNRAAAR